MITPGTIGTISENRLKVLPGKQTRESLVVAPAGSPFLTRFFCFTAASKLTKLTFFWESWFPGRKGFAHFMAESIVPTNYKPIRKRFKFREASFLFFIKPLPPKNGKPNTTRGEKMIVAPLAFKLADLASRLIPTQKHLLPYNF